VQFINLRLLTGDAPLLTHQPKRHSIVRPAPTLFGEGRRRGNGPSRWLAFLTAPKRPSAGNMDCMIRQKCAESLLILIGIDKHIDRRLLALAKTGELGTTTGCVSWTRRTGRLWEPARENHRHAAAFETGRSEGTRAEPRNAIAGTRRSLISIRAAEYYSFNCGAESLVDTGRVTLCVCVRDQRKKSQWLRRGLGWRAGD